MKRLLFILMLSGFLLVPAAVVPAAELEANGTALRKLQRGFLNMALCPIEVAHELSEVKNTDYFLPTWVTGLWKGTLFMTGRAVIGAYEILTFPFPLPSGYEPVIYPEFSWEYLEPGGNSENQE